MLILNSKTTIITQDNKNIVFSFINSVEITSSSNNLTSTALITIPRKLTFEGKNIVAGLNTLIRRGDYVEIELGYFPNLRRVFIGYITEIDINSPMKIRCEDEMYLLKNKMVIFPTNLNKPVTGITKINLKDFLRDQIFNDLLGVEWRCLIDEVEIPIIRFNCTAARCLDIIKDKFPPISFYFEMYKSGNQMFSRFNAAFVSDVSQGYRVDFNFENDIIDYNNLKYQREEDIQLEIKGTSINPSDNSRISVLLYWDGKQTKWADNPENPSGLGAHRQLYTTKYQTEAELKEFVLEEMKKLRYTGYVGTFLTFGEPYVQPGWTVRLESLKYPERNGTYLVKSVTRKFGTSGYRQLIEVGIKINN
jgi:hypothetical protein